MFDAIIFFLLSYVLVYLRGKRTKTEQAYYYNANTRKKKKKIYQNLFQSYALKERSLNTNFFAWKTDSCDNYDCHDNLYNILYQLASFQRQQEFSSLYCRYLYEFSRYSTGLFILIAL